MLVVPYDLELITQKIVQSALRGHLACSKTIQDVVRDRGFRLDFGLETGLRGCRWL